MPGPAAPRDVLSLPFELRHFVAFRADIATAIGSIFIDAVAFEQKHAADVIGSQSAALDHLQRFGGSVNLNLHYHAIFTDDVFAANGEGRVGFYETGAPSWGRSIGLCAACATGCCGGSEDEAPRRALAGGTIERGHGAHCDRRLR